MLVRFLRGSWAAPFSVLIAVALAVHALGSLLERPPSGVLPLFDTWLYNGLLVAIAILAATSARARKDSAGWVLLAVGVASWAAGDFYWTAVVRSLDPEPFPSLADGAWLSFYPLTYLGLALIARHELPRLRAGGWLDGVIVGGGTAALAFAFVLPPVLGATEGGFAAIATNLAYPIGDIALLSLVVTVMSWFSWRSARYWWLLAAGLATFVVVDTIYLVKVANDSYTEGTAADTLWPFALFLVALAGRAQNPARRAPLAGNLAASVPPVAAAGAAIALLLADRVIHVSAVSIGLAATTAVAAAIRSLMWIRVLKGFGDTRRQAYTDELTGLGNRRLLYRTLDRELASSRTVDGVALLLLDLDRFKEVNDSLGHHTGDRLLQAVGPRLGLAVRAGDVVVRLGGDEFAIVLKGPVDSDEAVRVAWRVTEVLAAPFELEGITLRIEASIGVVLAGEHGVETATLLRHADAAMYAAKSAMCGVTLYAPEHDRSSRERLKQIEALRAALEQGAIEVHFQPICELATGQPVGMEALARWTRADGVQVPPMDFVPMTEELGLTSALTDHVLARALAGYTMWRRLQPDVTVSVNLTAADLMDVRLPERVAGALARAGLRGDALVVEITENTLMTDPSRARAAIEELHGMGVRVAIDDFGTGFSSLAYLRDLPVDELKLDRSFIVDVPGDERATAIVASAIALAHSLRLQFVAEGIETAAVREVLQSLGADAAQGWHFGRPMPIHDATAWLSQFDPLLSVSGG